MAIKLQVDGWLGKDPYVQTVGDKKVTVLSLASRRGASRHADWITGTIWDQKLQDFVRSTFKKGDKVQAFGVMSKLSVYYSEGKPKPGLDMFINAISFMKVTKEEVRNE
jgi:hypothetical protein